MLQFRNKGALTSPVSLAAGDVVPFDTAAASNGLVTFDAANNAAVFSQAGIYTAFLTVTGISGAAGAVTLQAYSDGAALPYAAATEACDGKTAQSITLAVPLNAAVSSGSQAKITFVVDAAFTMSNAYGWIQAVV